MIKPRREQQTPIDRIRSGQFAARSRFYITEEFNPQKIIVRKKTNNKGRESYLSP